MHRLRSAALGAASLALLGACNQPAATAGERAAKAGAPAPRAAAGSPPRAAPAKPPAPPPLPATVAAGLDYGLRANLPAAHVVESGGVVADAARYGVVKYLRDMKRQWRLGVTEDERPVVLSPPRQAILWLPVSRELAGKELVVEVCFKPIGKQGLAVFFDGEKLGEQEIATGWQTVRQRVPARLAREQISQVRLYFGRPRSHAGTRTSAAIRYVRLSLAGAPALPADEPALAQALRRSEGDALLLPGVRAGLDYYVTPAADARLRAVARGGTVELLAQRDGKSPRSLGRYDGAIDLALDELTGHPTRLMLRAVTGAVTVSSAALLSAKASPPPPPRRPKRAIFWLVDALRADKLDFYGKRASERPKVKTPNISAMVRQGTVFDPFWVPSNESKAGHASYFTGTYPEVHRVLHRPDKLGDAHVTLAEAFRKIGYRTAAFVSNGFISARWNYVQGFERVANFIRENRANDAKAVVNEALPWIERHKDEPFYLYLGTCDTHVSYRVHSQFIRQYDRGPQPYHGPYRKAVSGAALGRIKGAPRPPPPRERERIEAVYENALAYNDMHFGRLVARLQQLGLYDDTLFIFAADHGEEFWEHGSCGHGHSLFDEMVSVPFALRFPGVIPAGHTVTHGADGVDLAATIFALLGMPAPEETQGESLLPYMTASNVYPRVMIASDAGGRYAAQVASAKVLLRSAFKVHAFDLRGDPGEHKNVYATRPVLTLTALDPLTLFIGRAKRWDKATWGAPNNLRPGFPATHRKPR